MRYQEALQTEAAVEEQLYSAQFQKVLDQLPSIRERYESSVALDQGLRMCVCCVCCVCCVLCVCVLCVLCVVYVVCVICNNVLYQRGCLKLSTFFNSRASGVSGTVFRSPCLFSRVIYGRRGAGTSS